MKWNYIPVNTDLMWKEHDLDIKRPYIISNQKITASGMWNLTILWTECVYKEAKWFYEVPQELLLRMWNLFPTPILWTSVYVRPNDSVLKQNYCYLVKGKGISRKCYTWMACRSRTNV
jgi:hypothetical protein